MAFSFYWHDYETFGADPRADRPAQFAGQRTDAELNPIGEPLEIHCRLSPDYLPSPEACALTGIGPGTVQRLGLRERDFIRAVLAEMAQPGTCTVGYNNLRFDDEVTRCALFRNLLDPYGREWQNGNSRWDLLDVLRMTRTFRPEGLEWPDDADGHPCFRLDRLSVANGIPHREAHTALADVHALIGLARRLRAAQPRLWDYALRCRDKHWVRHQVDPAQPRPVLHVSGMYPAILGSVSLVWPLGEVQGRSNEMVVWDLREPLEPFLDLDPATLRGRLYQTREELEQAGVPRLPARTLHLNRCPMVVPDLRLLTPALAGRCRLDPEAAAARGAALQARPEFRARILTAFQATAAPPCPDPDFSIYGGFFGPGDRAWLDRIGRTRPSDLGGLRPEFQDPRLDELFFRYRARNWPETLDPGERARWAAHCRNRLDRPPLPTLLSREAFAAQLEACRSRQPDRADLWQELADYAREAGGVPGDGSPHPGAGTALAGM